MAVCRDKSDIFKNKAFTELFCDAILVNEQ